jgi:PIN domain nuclease of toxin-antitoxin system
MRFLLDTQILMGIIEQNTDKFQPLVRRIIGNPANEFLVSVASIWEIAIKFRLGKLPLPVGLDALPDAIRDVGMMILPVNEIHAIAGLEPEPRTRDPFDRLLLAQCKVEGLRLVTVDRALVGHPLAVG